jgi:hypothetical protein
MSMNKLPTEKRALALQMMAEGISLRAIVRLTSISRTTLLKLLEDAGGVFRIPGPHACELAVQACCATIWMRMAAAIRV